MCQEVENVLKSIVTSPLDWGFTKCVHGIRVGTALEQEVDDIVVTPYRSYV